MFDTRRLLEQLLSGASDLARRGEDAAARAAGVGDDPAARQDFRKGALGGAAGGAALALLLGTKTGRSLGQAGALAGGLAVVGKLAHDAWVKRQAGAAPAALPAPAEDARARVLLAALVAAAKSDGHVDRAEMALIRDRLGALGPEAQELLIAELAAPLDAGALAARAPDPQLRHEVMAVTLAFTDPADPPEAAWREQVRTALGIAPEVAAEIEAGLGA